MDPVFVHKSATETGKQHVASVEFKGESDEPSLSATINNDHLPVFNRINTGQIYRENYILFLVYVKLLLLETNSVKSSTIFLPYVHR